MCGLVGGRGAWEAARLHAAPSPTPRARRRWFSAANLMLDRATQRLREVQEADAAAAQAGGGGGGGGAKKTVRRK